MRDLATITATEDAREPGRRRHLRRRSWRRWAGSAAAVACVAVTLTVESPGPAAAGLTRYGTAQVVVDWNRIALRASAAAAFDPPLETRNLAIVQAAVFDAVVAAVDAGYRPYAIAVPRPARGSAAAATAAAAHASLVALYPDQRSALDETYREYLALLPPGADTDRGAAIGQATGTAMVALRAQDGSGVTVSYTPRPEPGRWQPTPPALRPALDPGWGRVTPFLLASQEQFRPGPPPALTSAAYARDLAEIKGVGAVDSTVRTQDQTDTARFWVATAPQLWNQSVQQLVVSHRLSIVRAARAFALLNLTGADAFIASWDAKFTYEQWRPVTGIRDAGADGNPATTADPTWTPLLVTPPFPDYPSAHAVYGGAAEVLLTALFGPRPGRFRIASGTAPGVVHTYSSFHAVADEIVDARVWGGVHWRGSDTSGRSMGHRIARYVVSLRT